MGQAWLEDVPHLTARDGSILPEGRMEVHLREAETQGCGEGDQQLMTESSLSAPVLVIGRGPLLGAGEFVRADGR